MMTFAVDNLTEMHRSLQRFAEYLRGAGLDEDDVFNSRLVGCELLTNVIRHCGHTAFFSGGVEGELIVISVSSEGAKKFELCRGLPDALAFLSFTPAAPLSRNTVLREIAELIAALRESKFAIARPLCRGCGALAICC